jgi:sugar phosphate permease
MERAGLRRTMLAALSLLAVGVALTALMRQSWHLVLLWGVVVGAGTGVIANVLGAIVAARWFTARRGLVVGILSGSAAGGQLIFLPTLASVTQTYGWRPTVLIVAAVAFVVIPLVAILMRERPEDVGLLPYGEATASKAAAPACGNPFGAAISTLAGAARSRDFWLLAGSFFLCGGSTSGLIGTHLIPAWIDHCIPEVTAAGLLAAMGVFNIVGTAGSGWLSDHLDNRVLLAVYYSLRGLSLMYLPFSFVSFYGLSLFTIFYGLDWLASVPPTVRLSADIFGKEKAGIMIGWIYAFHQLGGAAAAFFGGAARSDLGSYLEAFVIAGLLCFAAATMVLFIASTGVTGRGNRRESLPAAAEFRSAT